MNAAEQPLSRSNSFEEVEEQKFECEALKRSRSNSLKASLMMPPRGNIFGFAVTKPVSLVVLDLRDKCFHLSQAAKDYLAGLQGECYVISVSGSPVVGKSFFLNLLLSFFTYYNNDIFQATDGAMPYKDIYTVGDGKKSTTEGIDMYCISVDNKNFIFLDVEGDNDPNRKETGIWIYSNLISAAIGVSHIHLYNYNGFPQETFFNYFESVNKLIQQNQIHPEFPTHYAFVKRNHILNSQEDLIQDLEEYKEYFDEKLNHEGLEYSIYMLPTPPKHLIQKRAKDSCLATTGFICGECQYDIFMSIFLNIYNDLNGLLNKSTSFKGGEELIQNLERILEVNKKELPYFLDSGHISTIRINKLMKEKVRINTGMMEVEIYESDKNLSQQIEKIFNDHPNLADLELFNNFDRKLSKVILKISQMEYLVPELSKFVEECLIDDSYSVLDSAEKEMLLEIYVKPFDELTKDILENLKEYEKIVDLIIEKIRAAKQDLSVNLKAYTKASFDARARTAAVTSNLVASSVIGFVAREVAVKVLAGCLIGGAAVGAALTIYAFYHAKKKFDKAKKKNVETINAAKIVGIESVEQAEKEIKRIEEFMGEIIIDLEGNNQVLKEVCKEEKSRNYQLIQKIEEVLEKKISGEPLDIDDRVKLIRYMKVASNNLERFKQSI